MVAFIFIGRFCSRPRGSSRRRGPCGLGLRGLAERDTNLCAVPSRAEAGLAAQAKGRRLHGPQPTRVQRKDNLRQVIDFATHAEKPITRCHGKPRERRARGVGLRPRRHRRPLRAARAARLHPDFPLGRGWVAALPAYNEHLVRDVGGLFLATGLVLVAAAWFCEWRLAIIACASYLLFALPHAIYHYLNLGPYSTGDAIGNVLTLAATVVVPLWVLYALRRRPSVSRSRATARRPRERQRPHRRGAREDARPGRAGGLPRIAPPLRRGRRPDAGLRPPPEGDGGLLGARARLGALEPRRRPAQAPGRDPDGDDLGLRVVSGLRLGDQPEAGVDEADLRALPTYASSERFSALEKLVLDYATAMSRSPVEVPDRAVRASSAGASTRRSWSS